MRFSSIECILFMVGLLLITGCQTQGNKGFDDDLDIVSVIEQRTAEWQDVLLSDDVEDRMNFYDADATLSPDAFPTVYGKEAIRSFLARGMKMARFTAASFDTDIIQGKGEYIQQAGMMNSKIAVNDSQTFDNSSKFFYLWKRQADGSYKIVAEVYNTPNQDED